MTPLKPTDAQYFEAGLNLIHSHRTLHEKLAELVRLSAEAAGGRMGGVWLLDPAGNELHAAVTVGIPERYAEQWKTVPVGSGVCGVVVQTRIPDFVEDMSADPRFANAPSEIVRSGFSVPIVDNDGRPIGTLANHFPHPFRPTPYHFERNQVFATLIAAAIHSEHLFRAPAAD